MILIIMIMLMLGHLEVQSGALGGPEWGIWRLRVLHVLAENGAFACSEFESRTVQERLGRGLSGESGWRSGGRLCTKKC